MVLVEGIRPILPLIRNTPYGKRIQSKLQRDQMDGPHGGPYGGGGQYSPHGRQFSQPPPAMRRASQIDPYAQQSNVYGIGQNGVQQMGQPSLIPAQVRHINAQPMDAYGSQPYAQPRTPVNNLVSSQFGGNIAPAYSNGINGSNGGYLASSMNDPYQRAAYPYA